MKKSITLLLMICTLVVSFSLSFNITPVYADEEVKRSIMDDIIPRNDPPLKYEQYYPSNYELDVYVPDEGLGESLKFWKWGDKVKENLVANIFGIIGVFWDINVAISTFVTNIVGQSMSLNVVAEVGDKVGEIITKASGFDGSWGNKGIYSELIGLMLALLVCWMVWVGYVQRRQTEMLGGFLKALGILVFTLGFFANAGIIIKGLNNFSEQTNKTVLDATQNTVGVSKEYVSGTDSITDLTHTLLVKQPYYLLQFGTTDAKKIGDERIKKLLTTTDGEKRIEVLKAEVEKHKNTTITVDSTFDRMAFIFLLYVINVPLWCVLALCSFAILFYQLMFIIVALMSPVMLLMALVPAWTGTAKKFLSELFRTLLMKVAIGFLLTLMFWVSSILYSATDKYGYLLVAALQVLSFLGVWLYRKTIFDAITTVPANAGVATASDALNNIKGKYNSVKQGAKTSAKVGAATAKVGWKAGKGTAKGSYNTFKKAQSMYADRKDNKNKAAEAKRQEKEQLQLEKEQSIDQLKREDQLAERPAKAEVAATTEKDQELAVRPSHTPIDDNDGPPPPPPPPDDDDDGPPPGGSGGNNKGDGPGPEQSGVPVEEYQKKEQGMKREPVVMKPTKEDDAQPKEITPPQAAKMTDEGDPQPKKITPPQAAKMTNEGNPQPKEITPPQAAKMTNEGNPQPKEITPPQAAKLTEESDPQPKEITPPQAAKLTSEGGPQPKETSPPIVNKP
ncbi:CD3337/EF1877 family mobilome membrane protein, partial [Bacillus cereus]|uniref:CD3337/EF1877 family mobilome membrane protein n=1 Tax=Bacillus cereus TaxID=1396 RepID=UPI000BFA9D7E